MFKQTIIFVLDSKNVFYNFEKQFCKNLNNFNIYYVALSLVLKVIFILQNEFSQSSYESHLYIQAYFAGFF